MTRNFTSPKSWAFLWLAVLNTQEKELIHRKHFGQGSMKTILHASHTLNNNSHMYWNRTVWKALDKAYVCSLFTFLPIHGGQLGASYSSSPSCKFLCDAKIKMANSKWASKEQKLDISDSNTRAVQHMRANIVAWSAQILTFHSFQIFSVFHGMGPFPSWMPGEHQMNIEIQLQHHFLWKPCLIDQMLQPGI